MLKIPPWICLYLAMFSNLFVPMTSILRKHNANLIKSDLLQFSTVSSWVVWVIVLPTTSRHIEGVVPKHPSISEPPRVAKHVRLEGWSHRGNLLPIHGHLPVAEDGRPLLHVTDLVTCGGATRPSHPVLNEGVEAPTLQHVLWTLPTETGKEHFFFSRSSKSWGDTPSLSLPSSFLSLSPSSSSNTWGYTPFIRVGGYSGSTDKGSCGVSNGPRIVNHNLKHE